MHMMHDAWCPLHKLCDATDCLAWLACACLRVPSHLVSATKPLALQHKGTTRTCKRRGRHCWHAHACMCPLTWYQPQSRPPQRWPPHHSRCSCGSCSGASPASAQVFDHAAPESLHCLGSLHAKACSRELGHQQQVQTNAWARNPGARR